MITAALPVHWELCESMKAADVQRTLDQAIAKAALGKQQRPRVLSDNGSCYIASELRKCLEAKQIKHIHGRPLHPQTQGKIERYHCSMNNVVKLDHYYYPEELNNALATFVHHYNYQRYHESLDNVTPADRVLWKKRTDSKATRKDQAANDAETKSPVPNRKALTYLILTLDLLKTKTLNHIN